MVVDRAAICRLAAKGMNHSSEPQGLTEFRRRSSSSPDAAVAPSWRSHETHRGSRIGIGLCWFHGTSAAQAHTS